MSLKVGKFLNEIIHESQMGYVPGRDINFNNRVLRTAVNICKEKNLDFTITSLDAQKAYDSVSHSYISEVLNAYNFPASFISKVDLLNTNLKSVVQINGHLSESFQIQRGVKQGDALSCALFIISIDPLIRNLNENLLIPPLELCEGCKIKTSAYADDIAVITTNNDEAANALFNEYDRLTKCSGLTLNADKTEILNISKEGKNITKVRYNNDSLEIRHCEAVTICGNYLTLDDNKAYEKNVLDKITKLEAQLRRWRGRNLSLNGKMMIVKTFAISQLIFTSQFQVFRQKDLRRIEHLCYTFIWNGNDRVRRAYLKSERHNGGINGIDVDSFFRSIAVRHFIKSDLDPRLVVLNRNPIIHEDIKLLARETIRAILYKQLATTDYGEYEWVLRTPISLFVKTYSRSHKLLDVSGVTTVGCLNFENMTRQMANKIRKCLVPSLLLIIDRQINVHDTESQISICYDSKWHELCKVPSRILNFVIKETRNKICTYKPGDKYKIDNSLFGDLRSNWHNLWRIKNPTLRAIRHKILYKDVWTNEKRCRLKISKDDKCPICGEIETVFHQLFICSNARRLWNILKELTGEIKPESEANYARFISVSNDYIAEIIKCCIFKLLIQIDRSSTMETFQVHRYLIYWLRIDYHCLSKTYAKNNTQLGRLNSVIRYLEQHDSI